MIYLTPAGSEGLSQGDILNDCPVFRHRPDGLAQRGEVRGVVLTQACDLEQRKAQYVLIALVYPAEEFVRAGGAKVSTVRDQVRLGKTFGQYFLPEAPPPIGLPESIIDLRDLHTVPRDLLDGLVAAGKRVC